MAYILLVVEVEKLLRFFKGLKEGSDEHLLRCVVDRNKGLLGHYDAFVAIFVADPCGG
ncbi:MAG: hypothetical protein IPH31_14680 [Lewinellaceae bacterium]|nr:hypothetical protein [Lewinellaceae bacterium]